MPILLIAGYDSVQLNYGAGQKPLDMAVQSLPRASRFVCAVLGLYALVGGIISFVGWPAALPRLTDWVNTGISIQPNTALAVMAAGTAIVLLMLGWKRT